MGSVAIRRSYKRGDISIDPEAYQEFNTRCCLRGEVLGTKQEHFTGEKSQGISLN